MLAKLQADVAEALADPAVIKQFESLGAEAAALPAAAFKEEIARDIARNAGLIGRLKLANK